MAEGIPRREILQVHQLSDQVSDGLDSPRSSYTAYLTNLTDTMTSSDGEQTAKTPMRTTRKKFPSTPACSPFLPFTSTSTGSVLLPVFCRNFLVLSTVRRTDLRSCEQLLRHYISVLPRGSDTWSGFVCSNIWRPLRGPVMDAPLALCDSRTIDPEDLERTSDKVCSHPTPLLLDLPSS